MMSGMQDYYPNPETFDGFRFHKIREQEGESSKYLITSLDLDYVLFGHGRHAWYEKPLSWLIGRG